MKNAKDMVWRKSRVRMWVYCAVAVLCLATLLYVVPPVYDNNSHAITGTSIASDTTLSISLSTFGLYLDLTPTSSSGTFATTADDATGSSTAVIRVATNNITGYTLGIKASNPNSSTADKLISNNEKCENTPTSTKCAINSISSPTSAVDYADSDNTTLNNTWGYAPSHYNSTPNTTITTTQDPNTNEDITTTSIINYYPAPVNGDTIATTDAPNQEDTTANDGTLLEDEYTIDYGMRIDYSPYAGSYSTAYNNQSYIITAVGNLVPYSVSYNANKPEQAQTDTTVDNMPTAQAGNVQGGDTVAVLLSQKVPTIGTTNPTTGDYTSAGYVFNGWCTVKPQVPAEIDGYPNTHGYQVCPVDQQQSTQPTQSAQPDQTPARLFQPGDNFGIDQTVENTQILYAVWGAPAAVIFNGNGLTYSDATTATENIMTFIPTYADGKITSNKVNVVDSGIYRTPTLSTTENYIFKGWSVDQNATEATYTDEQAITNDLALNAYDEIALYAVWAYTTVITFDGNGSDSDTMEPFVIEAGQTKALPQNIFIKDGYVFNGWNTVATPTEQDPGEAYVDQAEYQAGTGSDSVILYAQWKEPVYLYNNVATMSKGTQTLAQLQASITAPTTTDYTADTSNSGVYEYDASVFGEASDAASTNKIYYYRGILESAADQGTYGSDGKATTYPNYVRLGNDTCWRIVRTTGSGGIKMIYNGTWTGTTCANSTTNAQLSTSYFNLSSVTIDEKIYSGLDYHNKQAVGYTYSNKVEPGEQWTTPIRDLFGATGNDTTTNTNPSVLKQYIEDWYEANMSTVDHNYTAKLEPAAGYCNDRTVYIVGSYTPVSVYSDDAGVRPYTTLADDTQYKYGAYTRNLNVAQNLSLVCPRGIVDNYSTTITSGGNGQLTYPIALLTADEMSFAGSGSATASQGSSYNAKSFLMSGSDFWSLSPDRAGPSGIASVLILHSGGDLGSFKYVYSKYGVRPAISLKPGTIVADGEGTATNPWTIDE